MCGIAGICNFTGNGIDEIMDMNQQMQNRGPDDGGFWRDPLEKVVLGHRRLSVIDLSKNGKQPMISHNDRFVICYNGEVYNYQLIKEKMQTEGIWSNFRGNSDTEVILEAFAEYGLKKTLALMKGMFAIALWDRQEKVLYLIRDRVGEKPLYYGFVGKSFVFASDMAAIRVLKEFHNPINDEILPLYFKYGYIPAPYTIYKNLYKVLPGEIVSVHVPFDKFDRTIYWNMEETALSGRKNLFCGTEEEAALELERILLNAIQGQMVADVPVGAFLSGGVDSSLIVSLMQQVAQKKVHTYTVGFEEKEYDEAKYAKEIARHLGTEHTEMYVSMKDAQAMIDEIPKTFSEPFADSSQIPTMLVSQLTKKYVTVALSGDAGDELFCGYNHYTIARTEFEWLQNKFKIIPEKMRKKAGRILENIQIAGIQKIYRMGNYLQITSPEEDFRRRNCKDYRYGRVAKSSRILPHYIEMYQDGMLGEIEDNLMLMDLKQYHPDDILVKVDRTSMRFSLETRIPLLDRDVVEFAWRLPLSYKYDGKNTKRVMRSILYKYVPKELIERPKKGFSAPIKKWLTEEGEIKNWAQDMIHTAHHQNSDILNTKVVDELWRDFQKGKVGEDIIWRILMLEQWLLSEF